jgi:hypothetical protein
MTDMFRDDEAVILDGLALAYAYRAIAWAVQIGEQSDYRGGWLLGLHATGLRGQASAALRQDVPFLDECPTFDAEEYREVTTSTHLEMRSQSWRVAERLTGRLVRALGSASKLATAFQATAESN